MRLWNRDRCDPSAPRLGFFEELERLGRRARRLALATPLLVLVGFGTGTVTSRTLDLPDEAVEIGAVERVPRMRLEALSRTMQRLHDSGTETAEWVAFHQEHVAPVERVLRRRGVPEATARRMALPIVEQSYRRQLDVATVLSIIIVESNARPNATSSVGARGLMQVMPLWAGYWRGCGRNLYEIEDNLCNGTHILAWYLRRFGGNERRALLGYNGCVRGTNTPRCHTYPDKVARLRRQIARELEENRPKRATRPAAAAD